jgi:uncharacterized protein
MEILHKDNGIDGKFYILVEGIEEAEMTYEWLDSDRIAILHTGVNESLKGMGAGKQLVVKAVEFAREKGIRILPLCPFAKSIFDKVESLRDVL